MSREHETKNAAHPVSVAPKKAPAPVQKDPHNAPTPKDFRTHEWVLEAPPTIEIVGMGKHKLTILNIWIPVRLPSSEHRGPRFRASVLAGDWLTVRSASAVLPVAGEPNQLQDATYAIELNFYPPDDAVFQGTLEIEVLDAPGTTFRIPIRARSDFSQRDLMQGPRPSPPIRAPQPSPTKQAPPDPPAQKARKASEAEAWEINAPSTIELVGSGSGRLTTSNILVSATLPASASESDRAIAGLFRGPQVLVTVSGGSPVTIRSAPTYLPVEGVSPQMQDPTSSLALDFLPLANSTFHETLDMQVLDGPYQALSIPIVAYTDFRQRWSTPLSTPKPDVKSGRIKLPSTVHLGDLVVGSRSVFTIAAPRITGGHRGAADLRSIDSRYPMSSPGTPALELPGVSLRPSSILPRDAHVPLVDGLDVPIEVVFAPARPGSFTEALEVSIAWDDNHRETHRISITALAHGLKDVAWKDREPVPPATSTKDPATDVPAPTLTQDQIAFMDLREFDAAATGPTGAAFQAGILAEKQRDGVDVARGEIAKFKRQQPESPWWVELLEVAVLSGIAGVAAVAARGFAKALLSQVSKTLDFPPIIPLDNSRNMVFTIDSLKESMKQAGKAAVATVRAPSPDHGPPKPRTQRAPNPVSDDPTINFFATQRNICTQLHIENATMIEARSKQFLPELAVHPRSAIAQMQALRSGFMEAHTKAPDTQALATVSSWMQGIARETLGTETLAQRKHGYPSDTVTRMDPDKGEYEKANGRHMVDGVISMVVLVMDNVPNTITKVRVKSAHVVGIAQTAVNRLATVPISEMQVPLQLQVLSSGTGTTIKRDEAGRIRVKGMLAGSSNELDMHRIAETVVELVGEKSLKQWAVTLRTDDVNAEPTKPDGAGAEKTQP